MEKTAEKGKDVWRIKRYRPKVKKIDIYTGKNVVVLNEREAQGHDIYAGYRAIIRYKGKELVAVVDVAGDDVIARHEIGVFRDVAEALGVSEGDEVEVVHMNRPASLTYIRKKLDNIPLTREEIFTIIEDIMANRLNEGELGAWVAATYTNGLNDDEVVALTDAIVASGEVLELNKPIVADKHCIGGVAGNRTTMLVVPIVAACGVYIPKTSSRAITSPAGTADTMEVLAQVDFNIHELKEIVLKAHGAMVWGGGLNLASADDVLIKIRNPLRLDPPGMLLASIMAKKKAVGSNRVIIDIPIGRGAKIEDLEKAKGLARSFLSIGEKLGMRVETLITDGSEPIGNGIGPVLEARDVLLALEGKGPSDLIHKSLLLAGKLLELADRARKGEGYVMAEEVLKSGKALKKMRQIIELQGGNPNIKPDDLQPGPYTHDVIAERAGRISHIDNKKISQIARIAGCPLDKGAGIYLWKKKGDKVKKGDKLFTVYAESETKLEYAIQALEHVNPVEMERILIAIVD